MLLSIHKEKKNNEINILNVCEANVETKFTFGIFCLLLNVKRLKSRFVKKKQITKVNRYFFSEYKEKILIFNLFFARSLF